MKHNIYIALSICFLLSSCNLVTKEVTNWMQVEESTELVTKTHLLEEDDIKISLPLEFERYSLYDYQQRLDSVATKTQYKSEVSRINALMELEGNLYIYFDSFNNASYTANTMPYMPFTREEASMVLGIIGQSMRQNAAKSDIDFKKVTAKYFADDGRQTFKAIYKMYNDKKNVEWYSSTYVISENRKTIWLQLSTPFLINFDPTVAKTVF